MLKSPVFKTLSRHLPLDGLLWDTSQHPQAAVLVGLSDAPEPRVLLGRRTHHMRHHPGEVAFPGGKRESGDDTPWATALREAMEEVGMPPESPQPLGELPPLVTRTGFEVHPCVAAIPGGFAPIVDVREFDTVFSQPLARFADRRLFRLEDITVEGCIRTVPHYDIDGDTIWGVTAAVLALLANIAYDAGLELHRDWSVAP